MKPVLLRLIKIYQTALAPYWPSSCRYVPTCSQYAYDSIEQFGAVRGAILTIRRLASCVPWGHSTQPPMPPVKKKRPEIERVLP